MAKPIIVIYGMVLFVVRVVLIMTNIVTSSEIDVSIDSGDNDNVQQQMMMIQPMIFEQQLLQQMQHLPIHPRKFRHEGSNVRVLYQTGVSIYINFVPILL